MHFLKFGWQHRLLRGSVWTLISLFTLTALFYAWADWSGARRWRAAQAMLAREGETIDFRATTPEPIPDAENFCAIPPLKDITLVIDGDERKGEPGAKRARLRAVGWPSDRKGADRPKLGSAAAGLPTDLKAWASWLRQEGSLSMPEDSGDAARDVLAALSAHQDVFAELSEGLDRGRAQWTPAWRTRELPENLFSILLPHLSVLTHTSQVLELRSAAAAHSGEVAKAHQSVQILARLDEASLHDPFLIGLLVGVSGTQNLVNATWELCDAQAGTAEDFASLESALTKLDFRHATLQAFRSELAGAENTVEFGKRSARNAMMLFNSVPTSFDAGASVAPMWHCIPAGFFDANAAVLAEHEYLYVIKPFRESGWQTVLTSVRLFENELRSKEGGILRHPTFAMAALIAPAFTGTICRSMYTQSLVDRAVIACALERYRIAKGTYPASLDLVKQADGKPLPLDPMTGKPMGYRIVGGKYALWSVGFDGKDDGGKRVLDLKSPGNTKFYDANYVGDWVWDFPAD